jgi:hypothetical protein
MPHRLVWILTKRALWTDDRDPVSRKENGVLCLEAVSKPQITFEDKAQVGEKAEHTGSM